MPKGAESCNILVGTVNFVAAPVTILARLKESVLLEDFCEISTNTRFLGMILGPAGSEQQITDMGKALGTIMSDQVSAKNLKPTHFLCIRLLPSVSVGIHAVEKYITFMN